MERRHDIKGRVQQDAGEQPSSAARHKQDDGRREGVLHEGVLQVSVDKTWFIVISMGHVSKIQIRFVHLIAPLVDVNVNRIIG